MVLAVGDVDKTVGVRGDVDVELARIGAWLAPARDQLAVGRKLVDPGVAIPIGNIDTVWLQ
jgi:hypothetical protein